MKVMRLMWLIVSGVLLLPLIVLVGIVWLGYCIRSARYLEMSIKEGVKVWLQYIKAGLEMNKDFVNNGF